MGLGPTHALAACPDGESAFDPWQQAAQDAEAREEFQNGLSEWIANLSRVENPERKRELRSKLEWIAREMKSSESYSPSELIDGYRKLKGAIQSERSWPKSWEDQARALPE